MPIKNRNKKLTLIAHIIGGILVMLHGVDAYENGDSSYAFFLPAGLLLLFVAVFHRALVRRFPLIDATFFAIESALCFVIAIEYFREGREGLPYAYVSAGVLQIIALLIFVRKKLRKG